MKIFFLGDIVGKSGRLAVVANLKDILEKKKIDFVIVNGETLQIKELVLLKKFQMIYLIQE